MEVEQTTADCLGNGDIFTFVGDENNFYICGMDGHYTSLSDGYVCTMTDYTKAVNYYPKAVTSVVEM